jgi:hypothetical protein
MTRTIDTLLLLALPASGKSELRRYLEYLDPGVAREEFHIGPTVQLDDYPYVHLMRRISEELNAMGEPPVFFDDGSTPFTEPRDWGTLIRLLNEDYRMLGTTPSPPDSAAVRLFERFDAARRTVGAPPALAERPASVRDRLAAAIEDEARLAWDDLASTVSSWTPGDTVVIEFARGGPDGATPPLDPPYGYAYSLSLLSDEIRRRASILYVWVTPEESRRRNRDRARPGRDGDASILHHGVPEAVMLGDYGTDDLPWLIERSGGTSVRIGEGPDAVDLPVAVFDNREDRTSFLRADPDEWPADAVDDLHGVLRTAFDRLAGHHPGD